MASVKLGCTVLISYLLLLATICNAGLSSVYYQSSCPQAADIIKREVTKMLKKDRTLVGPLLRLQFHDAWVNGVDGSVLIKSTATNLAEIDAHVNFELGAILEIAVIKAALETECPNTVSCADIIACAARDATVFAKGPSWPVLLGRRDSRVSRAIDADTHLPFPVFRYPELVKNFAAKGFNAREMIVLSGAHTLGQAHCNAIGPNLYDYTGQDSLNDTNPNLSPAFATRLKQTCPKGNKLNEVDMDRFPNKFDNLYFKEVLSNKGYMITDDELIRGKKYGRNMVQYLSKHTSSWRSEFANAMAKMSQLSPLLAPDGEIRKNCEIIN
ncbi:hypothetical protein R1sor_025905 [Riccia sorocarpa]|uniref:Peroxidase n=1 Tax=Riccia sorocarpa TaxID=122646 RepID=A0ABD3GBJ7_9MARC